GALIVRRAAAVLSVILVGAPIAIAQSTAVAGLGAAALVLCGFGILIAPPALVGGIVLALGEYTLALALAGGPPRLVGAALLGVVLLLLLETADFGRRAHRATIGPGLVAAQMRAGAAAAALPGIGGPAAVLGGVGARAACAGAGVASARVRLPWAPAIAAIGVAITLVTVALALSARRLPRA